MSHELIIINKGEGEGGSAVSEVRYTPSHEVPEDIQFKKLKHAHKVLERLNDYLYGAGHEYADD